MKGPINSKRTGLGVEESRATSYIKGTQKDQGMTMVILDKDPEVGVHTLHRDVMEDSAHIRSAAQARVADRVHQRAIFFCVLIILVGCGAAASFITVGVGSARREQDDQFDRRSSEIVNSIVTSWNSYEIAGLHVHETCYHGCTRLEFRDIYEYILSTGLVFQVLSFNPNTTNDAREALENESTTFYNKFYPNITFQGIVGLEPDSENPGTLSVQPRSNQSFYFPVHLLEPVEGNEGAIDFDLYSSESRRTTIHTALDTWGPSLTPRLRLVQETSPNAYSVILMHPGIPLTTRPDLKPCDLASVVVRIPDLIEDATKSQLETMKVYVYDASQPDSPNDFLGGATVFVEAGTKNRTLVYEDEIELPRLRSSVKTKLRESLIDVASGSQWIIVVVAVEGTFQGSPAAVMIGGIFILVACCSVSVWLYSTMRRQAKISRIEAMAQAEKAALIVENAERSAISEREVNDFIAHEVRNPLSAAMSACSFVSTALNDNSKPLNDAENRKSALDDIHIIESSLSFINDLLRNMLDMQRAKSNQINIEWTPTDLKRDVLMPVDAMLYSRNSNFHIEVECPDNLIVLTDRMRLKQIMLNLGRNATKFVEKGYVRLRAAENDGNVCLYIEDSGPGIPEAKREQLFAKFQESLDSLNQGTGIGLSLCKNLADLMGAEIRFDDTFDSGIDGCPGSRFIINLNRAHIDMLEDIQSEASSKRNVNSEDSERPSAENMAAVIPRVLPDSLSVLFVDDDLVLRKLFGRAVKKVAPGWNIQEASNGESALKLVEEQNYDLIFMDQYMTSVEKQLLGTEATRALRAKGVTSRICGLSANDTEELFLGSGANAFMFKPFPCGKEPLTKELLRVLYEENSKADP